MATAPRKTATSAARKAPAKKTATARKTTTASRNDAIALLRADHRRVSELFKQYEGTRSAAKKKALVATICQELTVHAQIEEEIFYPAVKAALKDKELVPEAQVEHATLKSLIAQVKDKEPDGELFDAKVQVMSEYVKHHVKEEQNEMFPKASKSRLDMAELGQRLQQRKEELMADPSQMETPSVGASAEDAPSNQSADAAL